MVSVVFFCRFRRGCGKRLFPLVHGTVKLLALGNASPRHVGVERSQQRRGGESVEALMFVALDFCS